MVNEMTVQEMKDKLYDKKQIRVKDLDDMLSAIQNEGYMKYMIIKDCCTDQCWDKPGKLFLTNYCSWNVKKSFRTNTECLEYLLEMYEIEKERFS